MLDLLKPKNVHHVKTRLGPKEDGGYVMPEIVLEKCSTLFNYGVGYNYSYEEEFALKYKKPVHMFDHTVNHVFKSPLHFYNEGLGFGENCGDVIEHYNRLGIQGNIFLKIDVEGAEYDYFEKVDMDKLASITNGIILETHWTTNDTIRERCFNIIQKINKYFILCHTHGNNMGGTYIFEGYNIPDIFELSFINKNLVHVEEEDKQFYPIDGLDYPNNPSFPDYPLTFIK